MPTIFFDSCSFGHNDRGQPKMDQISFWKASQHTWREYTDNLFFALVYSFSSKDISF